MPNGAHNQFNVPMSQLCGASNYSEMRRGSCYSGYTDMDMPQSPIDIGYKNNKKRHSNNLETTKQKMADAVKTLPLNDNLCTTTEQKEEFKKQKSFLKQLRILIVNDDNMQLLMLK